MNLHENIVLDLLPLVRSDRASVESRQAVEQYLDAHPQLARYAAMLPSPDPDMELRALRRTRRELARAGWEMGLAIFFTFLPLSFVIDESGFRFLLAGSPTIMFGAWALAAGLWVDYFVRVRRSLSWSRGAKS